MNLIEYQPLALRTAKWYPSLFQNLEHAALGLVTEVGEFATVAKRVAIYGKEFTPAMRAHALEELGDVAWYCALAAETLGVTLDKIKQEYTDKLTSMSQAALLLAACTAYVPVAIEAMRDGTEDYTLATVRDCIGMTIGAVMIVGQYLDPNYDFLGGNIGKLMARYPEKYSDNAAEARADKNGADARNS